MKKLLVFVVTALICGTMLISCGGGSKNSPSHIVTKALNAQIKLDWDTYLSFISIEQEYKKELLELMRSYPNPNPITKFKIVSEKFNDAGDRAEVTVSTVMKDGTEETDSVCLELTENGWKMQFFTMGSCL